jgi:2-polyprenyl-6-methoxyphenol hydroxylase-like FAD-dependent oxidoreductase
MRVIIVGAGIGGLSLAIALRRRGIDVLVLEKRGAFADEGAGIVLGPNVMSAVVPLGLDAALLAAGRPLGAMNIVDRQGRVLARTAPRVAEFPHPAVAIHRSRLHEVLRAAYDGELRLGVTVERFALGARPAVWADDERLEADLVVGADGIRSALRDHLNPGFKTRYSGVTCWRTVVDVEGTDEAFEMWGPGKRVGVVPLAEGKSYVYLALNAPARAPSPFADLTAFRRHWAEFGEPARTALAAVNDLGRLLHNDLDDGIAPRWSAEGAVLLGDAAHAVTPNMGQGAGLAIEDACCLAALVGDGSGLSQALVDYERARRPRATWIHDQSYRFGRIAQLESRLGCWVRDRLLAATPASVSVRSYRRIVTDVPGVPVGPREDASPA